MVNSARPATIRDVARAAGLSIATVSRAFHNPELLTPDTRAAVEAAVRTLDYRPSLSAQRLRGTRTNLVLVVVPSLSPFFLDIFAGADHAARAAGYGVLVGHTDRDAGRERAFVEQVAAGRADGLILVTSVGSYDHAYVRRMPPTIVALDAGDDDRLPTVRIDHVEAATRITDYLLDMGHARIAHVLGAARSGMTSHRLQGYAQALERRGVVYDPALCLPGDFTVEAGEAAARAIVEMAKPPTAVFAANDQMAIGVMRGLRAGGRRVPEDISVVGFDNERLAALATPALSTVGIPTYDIGLRAMRQMIGLLHAKPIERDMVLETELVVRRSASPPGG